MSDTAPDDGAVAAGDRRWAPPAIVASVVIAASFVPVPGGSSESGDVAVPGAALADAVGLGLTDPFHLVGYAAVAALVARALGEGWRASVVAVGVAVAIGAGVEVVQGAIPWRTFAVRDALVNAVGAVLGVVGSRVVDRDTR